MTTDGGATESTLNITQTEMNIIIKYYKVNTCTCIFEIMELKL
jgi:hypothetical protein